MDERDPEAFRALYRAHYGTVCRYLAARVHRSAVEDVAAETFLRVDFDLETAVMPASGGVKDPTTLPKKTLHLSRTVFIDRHTYLPVRVVEHWPAPLLPAGSIDPVTDYVVAERLPRTPQNEALLRMSRHPGAKQITEGRLRASASSRHDDRALHEAVDLAVVRVAAGFAERDGL